MNMPYRYTAVYIQGRSDADEWVTSFKLLYFDEETSVWTYYTDALGSDVSTRIIKKKQQISNVKNVNM
jgi:hypothetical protein